MTERAKAGIRTALLTVTEAVQNDLNQMGDIGRSGLAASALALAAALDDRESSATAKSNCARELRETMERLRALAPPKRQKDGIDELAEKRGKRRSRRSAATG